MLAGGHSPRHFFLGCNFWSRAICADFDFKVSVLFVVEHVLSKKVEAWKTRLLASYAAVDVEQSTSTAPPRKSVCARGLGAVAGWRSRDRLSRANNTRTEDDTHALPAIRGLKPDCEYEIRAQVLDDKVCDFDISMLATTHLQSQKDQYDGWWRCLCNVSKPASLCGQQP